MRDGKLDGMQDFDTVIKDLIESRRSVWKMDSLRHQSKQSHSFSQGLTAAEDFIRREVDSMPVWPFLTPVQCWA